EPGHGHLLRPRTCPRPEASASAVPLDPATVPPCGPRAASPFPRRHLAGGAVTVYLTSTPAVDGAQAMIQDVEIKTIPLDDYAAVAPLSRSVAELRAQASALVPALGGRTVWMVNSTARGGGVAEMMPRVVGMLRELGVSTRWVVVDTSEPEFFSLTKRLHNLIHGSGDPALSAADHALYDRVSAGLAAELQPRLADGDVLVVHDPQPLGVGARVRASRRITPIWRSPLGLDEDLPQTRAAWDFLAPDLARYDRAVFSAAEYVPRQLASPVSIIHPGIDPLSHKNRELSLHKLVGILLDAQLVPEYVP